MVAKERRGILAQVIYHSNQALYLDVCTMGFVFTHESIPLNPREKVTVSFKYMCQNKTKLTNKQKEYT